MKEPASQLLRSLIRAKVAQPIIVAGGRMYEDRERVFFVLSMFQAGISVVAEGGNPRGTDLFAREWANENGVESRSFRPDWSLGNRAAAQRILAMIELQPAALLLFPGGKGTLLTAKLCKQHGIPVMFCGHPWERPFLNNT